MVVLGARRTDLERSRRRVADLRERASAQGREVVRAARAARTRRRGVAAHPRRPRPALRPRGADARPPALSARTRSLQPHAEDARVQGRGRGAQHELVPPAARGHVRQPRRGPGSGRADQGGAAQHPRAHAADLPARRRMRRRLQLRGEEHARLQLPDRRVARRRRDPHPLRGARVRAARGRRLDRPLHRAHRRARGAARPTRACFHGSR